MYRYWKEDPKSVHVSWAAYFSGLDKGMPSSTAFTPPPGFIGAGAVPAPADGTPKLDVSGSGDVTEYLKVSCHVRCVWIALDSHSRYNSSSEHTK
jgi:2-oxoglutarate dehydrogenase E1 component